MQIDLSQMSLKELKELRTQVQRHIDGYEERKKREALAAVEEKARALGFNLSELVGVATVRKRKPAKPKYANPADKSQTWTGRGRRPRWVDEALRAGKSLDDLAI